MSGRVLDRLVIAGRRWDRMTSSERVAHVEALVNAGARTVVAYKVRHLLNLLATPAQAFDRAAERAYLDEAERNADYEFPPLVSDSVNFDGLAVQQELERLQVFASKAPGAERADRVLVKITNPCGVIGDVTDVTVIWWLGAREIRVTQEVLFARLAESPMARAMVLTSLVATLSRCCLRSLESAAA